jgi:hypothetical protein
MASRERRPGCPASPDNPAAPARGVLRCEDPPQSYSMRWADASAAIVSQPRRGYFHVRPVTGGAPSGRIEQASEDGKMAWNSGLRHWPSWRE